MEMINSRCRNIELLIADRFGHFAERHKLSLVGFEDEEKVGCGGRG